MNRYLALLAMMFGACVASEDTQTLQGRVDRAGFSGTVLGARVVTGDTVVATAPVDDDGDFTLDVPVGTGYRLEIITSTGAQPIAAHSSGTVVHFDVCAPVDPYDVGDIYQGDAWPGCEDPTDPNCCVDADGDGNCDPGGTDPGCDPSTDPNCGGTGGGCTNPNPDGTCGDPPGCVDANGDGVCDCDPSTGTNCCDPATDPNCGGGGDPGCPDANNDGVCDCDPTTDPNCGSGGGCTNPNPDGSCGDPGCTDANGDGQCDCDPSTGTNCCDPATDPNCGGGGTDPGCDPSTGQNCGCTNPNPDGTCGECPYDDPTLCWPPPDDQPCDSNGVCDPGDCAVPEEEIPDFGCENW